MGPWEYPQVVCSIWDRMEEAQRASRHCETRWLDCYLSGLDSVRTEPYAKDAFLGHFQLPASKAVK